MSPSITVADLQQHADTLCRDHDIAWRPDPTMRLLGSYSLSVSRNPQFDLERDEIWTPPIRSRISYATVLHEIGHLVGRHQTSRHVMTRETWACR
jgi:hypothetical protein